MSLGGILTGIGLIVAFIIILALVRRRSASGATVSSGGLSNASVRTEERTPQIARTQATYRMPDHDPESAFLTEAIEELLGTNTLPGGPPMESTEADPRMLHRALLTLKGMDRVGETFSKFQEFNDPYASLEQIAKGVAKDVVFSSKVLRAANSAHFGYADEVTSVQHAVRILGYNNLKTLYFREHFRMLDPTESNATHRRGLWKHAMLTAVSASHIASAFGKAMPETAFTLGLMHDIGKFILCQMPMHEAGHKRIDRVMEWEPVVLASDELSMSVDLERKLLGVDHCLLGKMAMDDWELPELMSRVVYHHHSGHYAVQELNEESRAYVAVVHAADYVARVFEHRNEKEQPPGGSLEPAFIEMTSRPALEKAVLGGSLLQDLLNAEALARLS